MAQRSEDQSHERDEAWGDAPPYGAYRGAYGTYQQAQFGSLNSGLLGGWSAAGLGGSFDEHAPAEAELREERARLAEHDDP
jgi:hypothetical protein